MLRHLAFLLAGTMTQKAPLVAENDKTSKVVDSFTSMMILPSKHQAGFQLLESFYSAF